MAADKPDRHVSTVNHSACANTYEDRAFDLLRVGRMDRDPTPEDVAEAQALATLAQSHRIAEQTETLAGRLDTLDGTLGVGFSGMS